MTFQRHEKIGVPPMVRVTYYSGYRMFNEYVCIQHEGYAGRLARKWYRARQGADAEIPQTVDELLEIAPALKTATHLRIWINKKYPEIMDTCFDGTAFGKEEPSDTYESPTSEVMLKTISSKHIPGAVKKQPVFADDDIPF